MTATDPLPPSPSHPPKSTHLSDLSLHPFLFPTFSATTYLNSTLPPPPTASKQQQESHLSTITTQTQTHLTTLSAQTSRLSSTLTTLTDEILRRSARLGYEIEVLRGEANALVSALGEGGSVDEEIKVFLPSGLPSSNDKENGETSPQLVRSPITTAAAAAAAGGGKASTANSQATQPQQPQPNTLLLSSNASQDSPPEDSLRQLRTLLSIRTSLQATKQIFSQALSWPMPPSLLQHPTNKPSITPQSEEGAEAKGQEALSRLRGEIQLMLQEGEIEQARQRVQELKECVTVWKGTAEEKARRVWVEDLESWVEGEISRMMRLGREKGGSEYQGKEDRREREKVRGGVAREEIPARTGSGAGFLRRLREEIYLE